MCQSSSGDIISDLPGDVIDSILTHLSLRDAVRTSILSRRWRYKWTSLPDLVFDRDTFRGTTRTHDKLVIAILEVALHYRGSVVTFVLSLPGLKSCPQIDQLIYIVSKNCGLKEFTLHILEGEEPYRLPLSLFSWVELNRLSLQHCVVEPPICFKGFNRLISMEISKCSILPDVLSGLISSCPLLEEVKVSSPIPTEGDIEISAPNLRKLTFTGDFPSVCVKYTPRLSSCFMCLLGDLMPSGSNFFESLHNLPAIEDLKLDYYYVADQSVVEGNSIPTKLTTTLNNLTSLTLWRISFVLLHEVSAVLCLIRSSPNLVKIVVDAYTPPDGSGDDDDMEYIMNLFQVQAWRGVWLNSLREVEFNKICGTEPEMEFIELLLSISPKLETMIVTPHKKVALDDNFQILTQVTCLRRSSPLAKVIYG